VCQLSHRSTECCNLHPLLAPAYFFADMCMSVARTIVAAHAGRSPMRLVYAATAGQSARSTCAGAMLHSPDVTHRARPAHGFREHARAPSDRTCLSGSRRPDAHSPLRAPTSLAFRRAALQRRARQAGPGGRHLGHEDSEEEQV